MSRFCHVPNCQSSPGPGISFFNFTQTPKKQRKWLNCLGLDVDEWSKLPSTTLRNFKICSNHFDPKYIVFSAGRPKLTFNAIPSKWVSKSKTDDGQHFKNVNYHLKRKLSPSKMSNELQQQLQLPSKIAKSVLKTDADKSNTIGLNDAEMSYSDLKLEVDEQAKVIDSQAREILKYKKIIAGHLNTIESLRTEIKLLKGVELQDHGFEIKPEFDHFTSQPSPSPGQASELQNENVRVKMLPEQVQELIQECKTKRLVISIKKFPVKHHTSKFKLIPFVKTSYAAGKKLNKPKKREKLKIIKPTPSKGPQKITRNSKSKYICTFICTYCPADPTSKTVKTYSGLIYHVSKFHPGCEIPPKIYTCTEPGCGASFSKILDANSHLNIHTNKHKVKKFKCSECEECFVKISELWRHRKSEHPQKSVFCDKCGKILQNEDSLKRHLSAVHDNYRPYHCDKCPKSFSRKYFLELHQESHMTNLEIKCRYQNCDLVFKSTNSRNQHIYNSHLHSGEKFKDFNYKLKTHRQSTCPYCSKVLTTQMTLRDHILRIHKKNERKFKCDFPECAWSFPVKSGLEKHKQIHLSIQEQTVLKLQGKKAICDLCGLTVNQPYLKRHLKSHENNTGPCACSIDNCWKRFENERSLKIHQRNHYNPNPKMNFKSGPKNSKTFLNKMLNSV